jgi:hypothetical protein
VHLSIPFDSKDSVVSEPQWIQIVETYSPVGTNYRVGTDHRVGTDYRVGTNYGVGAHLSAAKERVRSRHGVSLLRLRLVLFSSS